MRWFLLLVALCGGATAALGNDTGIVGIGGRLQQMSDEHRSVRMVRETVRIDIGRNDYTTTADFEFRNNGPAVTVTMGFPEGGYGDLGIDPEKQAAFTSFVTSVNGRQVTAQRRPVQRDGEEGTYQTHWIKTVRFARNQTQQVRVRYRAPLGSSVARGIERFLTYQFTGGNWQGKVAETKLLVTIQAPGTYAVLGNFNNEPIILQRNGNRFTRTWRDWQAQGDFSFSLSRTLPGWLAFGNNGPFGEQSGQAQTVSIPGAVLASIEYLPFAVLRNGTTFISLSQLRERLATLAEKAGEGLGDQEVKLSWDNRTRTSTLRAGRYEMKFQTGSTRMQVSDHMDTGELPDVKLAAAPVLLGGEGRQQLYVPLAPIMQSMRGAVRINTAQHRMYFQVPNFLEPG